MFSDHSNGIHAKKRWEIGKQEDFFYKRAIELTLSRFLLLLSAVG
jgi:hypothetical protein